MNSPTNRSARSASLLTVVVLAAGCSPSVGATTDGGTDGAGAPLGFQPSNINLSYVKTAQAMAVAEDVKGGCKIVTDPTSPETDCFMSPITAVKQTDGSTVNLVVVKSLTVEKAGAISAQGTVPFVLISLGDITLSGTIDGSSGGVGGAAPASGGVKGGGAGGGAAGTNAAGGSGGSYCGAGGKGGGQTASASSVGYIDLRPLTGGSAGGGGAEASGAGGGAIQLVANGALTIQSGSYITVGGGGGFVSGVASAQNAAGGGSGGSILLEATTIDVAGILASNGGGGGGDYSGTGGANATPNATPAAGGTGGSSGTAGGAGGAGATPAGSPGSAGTKSKNAGGGGGGAGRICMNTVSGTSTTTGTISPATSTLCAITAKVRTFADGP